MHFTLTTKNTIVHYYIKFEGPILKNRIFVQSKKQESEKNPESICFRKNFAWPKLYRIIHHYA